MYRLEDTVKQAGKFGMPSGFVRDEHPTQSHL